MQSGLIEIVFLAMLAGFIGLRLYQVLGRRTGHEKPVSDPFRGSGPEVARPSPAPSQREREALPLPELPADVEPSVRPGLEEIRKVDRSFNPENFVAGARAAYQMILEAFWRGDEAELKELVSDEVLANFKVALAARKEQGLTLENRLLEVDNVRIVGAGMNGHMAEVTVQFDAEIVSATRDSQGNLVEGNPDQSVETHDVWTFSRHVTSSDPAWLLVGTDTADA
ncbi:MAG: Tim44/TimA family putative adaptor protein [Sphingomonadaceae bacterium]